MIKTQDNSVINTTVFVLSLLYVDYWLLLLFNSTLPMNYQRKEEINCLVLIFYLKQYLMVL
jgi:hypothetical protein